MDRNVFETFDTVAHANLNDSVECSEAEDGYESEEEDFNYSFPPDEDLPDEDLGSDEEYILTELGPMVHTIPIDDELPATDDGTDGVTPDTDNEAGLRPPLDDPDDHRLTSKDGTLWSTTPVANQKTPSKNIFKLPRTKHNHCNAVGDPVSAFSLYLPLNIISDIVKYTNLEGERLEGVKWKPTDIIEIQALIGVFIQLGAMNQNIFPTELIWDMKYGSQVARSTFTRNRFLKLSNRLRFDDKTTRSERRQRDIFAPIRDIWERFLSALKKHYNAGAFLTVDEQLIPWRGRCSFLQYLPSKPDKYGLKVFWCADAETMYPLLGKPYLGKIGLTPQVNLGRNTALELCAPFLGTGRNLTCDNFFTDMELCKQLNSNKMTVVGTLRRNKTFIPPEFQDPKATQKGESKFAFRKGSMLVSYKSGSKKNVIILSSMHSDATMVSGKGDKKLPEVVSFYNSTKGGVDCLDLMAHSMTTKRQTKRWPMIIFFDILDMASIAASVIFKSKFPDSKLSQKDNRRFFQLEIAKGLIIPQIERRRMLKNLPRHLTSAMDLLLDRDTINSPVPSQPVVVVSASKRKRCAKCPAKMDRKTPCVCRQCFVPICKDHTAYFCFACADEPH